MTSLHFNRAGVLSACLGGRKEGNMKKYVWVMCEMALTTNIKGLIFLY